MRLAVSRRRAYTNISDAIAMSTGARCIVSNTSSLPEIYGESVWYIDPLNYEDIDIDLIMRNPIEANDRVLDKFSWRHSAELLLSILREV